MKKIIGIFGVAVIAVAMLLNANTSTAGNNFDLDSLLSMNTANAECPPPTPWSNGGGCSMLGNCYWGHGGGPCDPWQWEPIGG